MLRCAQRIVWTTWIGSLKFRSLAGGPPAGMRGSLRTGGDPVPRNGRGRGCAGEEWAGNAWERRQSPARPRTRAVGAEALPAGGHSAIDAALIPSPSALDRPHSLVEPLRPDPSQSP